jgi:predicted enzyme related to lactoylglutathione lyase
MGCTTTAVDTSGMSFAAEPLLGKIIWNDLVTEDLEAARRFYGELFGWSFEPAATRDGRPYVVARSRKVLVAGIVQIARPADHVIYSRWLPYASVKDVDASVAKATAEGATVVAAARDVGFGRVAVIVDAEGAVMGLARSRIGDPDDRTTAPADGRVLWTELIANDPDAATRFYANVIGYVPHTIERHGGAYTLLASGGVDRAGIFRNPSEQATPTWLTSFGVDDPAAAAARAQSLGGKIILPPSQQLRGGTMALVEDPTGALLILQKTGS